jgi:DNA-binding CsgD family transcriptional regulator/PAS domain-containing protein
MWGGRPTLETWPLEEPAVANEIIPIERKRKNRYFIDVLEPRGFTDGVILPLARDRNLFCYIGLNRHVSFGDVTPDVVDGLRLLAPHIRRAVTISNLLDLQKVERATFASVLDAMTSGVVLVGEDMDILHANPAAGAMLSQGTVVADRLGKLQTRGPHAQTAMETAVKLAAQDETKLTRRGIGVPAQSSDGASAVLHVMPLNGGALRPGLFQRAVAAIFLASPDQSAHVPIDAISLLCDFTPAESQIFASLVQGKSLEETAAALGVARSTAKTHLLRIFDKTGCKRQAELIAFAARHTVAV